MGLQEIKRVDWRDWSRAFMPVLMTAALALAGWSLKQQSEVVAEIRALQQADREFARRFDAKDEIDTARNVEMNAVREDVSEVRQSLAAMRQDSSMTVHEMRRLRNLVEARLFRIPEDNE